MKHTVYIETYMKYPYGHMYMSAYDHQDLERCRKQTTHGRPQHWGWGERQEIKQKIMILYKSRDP